MSPSKWPEADAILDQALLLPPDERIAFVRSVAGEDQELAQHLERVVAESVDESGFLQPVAAMSGSIGDDVRRALDLSSSPRPALAAGARIEHYEVLALIGRGGMGEVYRAYDSRLHRNVALKVLPESFARSAERIARFRREARVLAMLSHPGIAAIYGIAESDGTEALVLELVEGPTLADRLSIGALSQSDAIPVARHLADAIAAAHASGILHRDLKPANIKVLPDGSVKVLDFGLAKALQPTSGDSTNLTAAAQPVLLGTAPYVPTPV